VIVKLTPNITDVRYPRGRQGGRADAVSLINTINSLMGVDLDLVMHPSTDGQGSHGGYCGPAVKPIALNMVAEIARDPQTAGLPISGIGGITTWRDAAEYIALGCGTVQVCTAAMVYGFKIVQDMCDGLSNYMDEHGFARIEDFQGRAVPTVRLERPEPQPHRQGRHQPGQLHPVRALPCGARTPRTRPSPSKRGRRAQVRGERSRVRGLQPVRLHLPGAGVHHHAQPAAGRSGSAHRKTVTGEYANWTTHPNNPHRGGGARVRCVAVRATQWQNRRNPRLWRCFRGCVPACAARSTGTHHAEEELAIQTR
jgi:dihydropyrimidine dehydrogenase (NAD+) subunit PreA